MDQVDLHTQDTRLDTVGPIVTPKVYQDHSETLDGIDIPTVRRKDIFIQEIDVGQPCLACGEKCPGYVQHAWRNICAACKCSRVDHDIIHDGRIEVPWRLGLETQKGMAPPDINTLRQLGYTWIPPGLTFDRVEDYMDQLDNTKIPRTGSAGARYRESQIIFQLPRQDLSPQYCRHLKTASEKAAYDDFRNLRDGTVMSIARIEQHALDNMSCAHCDGEIGSQDLAVFAPEVGEEKMCWHPACFTCSTCDELLADLSYCHHDNNIFCERHYAQLIKPRCAACDELIFSGEYTKAMDQDWHSGHFCCFNCDLNLTGHRYILREEHPYCIKCYEKLFANSCEDCQSPIGCDSKDLSYKEKHWHEKCFKCCDCTNSLVDQPFAAKNEKLYCADCHDNNFAARCDGCGNIFRAGMKKYEYKGKQWHEQCFCCKVCQQPIGNKSFIPREQEVVCVPCYEEQYAQRCMKCNGVINKGGITYKSTPWHRDCFTCTNCNKVLAGEKFTSRDEKPYCANCFGELFAKKCCRCTKPITGLGGTKFISFEERHWHSDCFQCYKCNTSLVGRGFLTDGEDILCPDCGRA